MLEIGYRRQRAKMVRGEDKKLRPAVDAQGDPVLVLAPSNVWRETREELDGAFGLDKDRKLIVGLVDGDLLVLRPKGTRQAVRGRITDIYRYLIMCQADRAKMEKVRAAKTAKAQRREARREKRMVAKWKTPA
jgi:hypothetical protein